MAANKRRKKPRGSVPAIELPPVAGDPRVVNLTLPDSKDAIEEYILNAVIQTAANSQLPVFGGVTGIPSRTREADLDFTIQTARGEEYVELVEFAPLAVLGGSYAAAPRSYNQGEMADLLMSVLQPKLLRYAPGLRRRLHLLVYSTDWRFHVSKGVEDLVAYGFSHNPPELASIVYFAAFASGSGLLSTLHPRALEELASFSPEVTRAHGILRADISAGTLAPNGGFEAPLTSPCDLPSVGGTVRVVFRRGSGEAPPSPTADNNA